jgi:tetratricopeptide (TPR) repeat protein
MDVRKRKRGIRASRAKLEAAMIKLGFETQAELANKIAELEGIEKPPKDLVSKVFREQAVSTHNLARIANALDVDAHTIYLTKEDDEFSEVVSTQQNHTQQNHTQQNATEDTKETASALPAQPNPIEESNVEDSTKPNLNTPNHLTSSQSKNKRKQVALASLFLIFIVSAVVYWQHENTDIANNTKPQSLASSLGKIKIIIQAPEELKPLAQNFASQLTQLESVSSTVANTPNSYYLSSYEALDKWQAQAVLKIGLVKGQYYQSISANISSLQSETKVLQTVLATAELRHQTDKMAEVLIANTKAFISGESKHSTKALNPTALASYLRAKNISFTAHSVVDFQRALDFFQQAISLEPELTGAHAGICQTQVRMSWIQDESSLLEQAAESCKLAEKLDEHHIDYKIAQAELYSRIGELNKAIALLESEASNNRNNADLLAAIAELYLIKFGQTNEQNSIEYAQSYANQAVILNSQHWRAYNTLGNLYFSTGDTQNAKEQFFAASNIVKHEVILANLGTLQMCFGELEQAKQTYSDVITNFTNNYIGYESLGSVYFFEQNYEQAVKNKLIAIEKQPDISIHQVWGGLAEAFLLNQQADLAWEHYAKALTLIERDELLENISFSDQLHKIYYQRKLANINPQQSPLVDLASKIDGLIEQRGKLGLKARSHLAWLAGEAKRTEEKATIWDEITKACSVYENAPELITQISQNP